MVGRKEAELLTILMLKKYISRGPHLRTIHGKLKVNETRSSGVVNSTNFVHSRVAVHLVVVPSESNMVAPSLRTWGSFVTLPKASAFYDQPLSTHVLSSEILNFWVGSCHLRTTATLLPYSCPCHSKANSPFLWNHSPCIYFALKNIRFIFIQQTF